jgi:hypothetical protein
MNNDLFTDAPLPKEDLFTDEPAPKPVSYTESLLRGAANNFPLAPQAISALEPGKYSENLEDWNAKAKTAKEANPKTYGVGAVGGALAPLAIPGVGEVLEAAPIAGNAALGVANALSNEDLTKDVTGNLKKAAIGGGIGGAIGGAGKILGNLVSSGGKAAERMEANATAGMFDLNSRGINRLTKGLENPEKVMNHINDKMNELFPEFGDWKHLESYTDTAGSKYQKLLQAHDQASGVIGQVIDATTAKAGKLPEVDSAIADLSKAAVKFNGKTSARNLEAFNELNDARQTLSDLQESGKMSFKDLYEVKKGIGESFNNPRYDNPGVDKAYGIVSDTIDKILDRVHVSDPELKESFNHQKEIFKFTSDLLPAMKKGVSKEVAGVGGGLLSAGLGTAAVMGHPAAVPAYAAKTAGKWLMPDLGQNIAYKGINALKNAPKIPLPSGQDINQLLNDYLVNHFKK